MQAQNDDDGSYKWATGPYMPIKYIYFSTPLIGFLTFCNLVFDWPMNPL